MPIDKLLTLSFSIQLVLAAGYGAYLIAYSGVRQHHTPTDALFRSLAFGVVASSILNWAPTGKVWPPVVATIVTLASGAFWRWEGQSIARYFLRKMNVSWADDVPTAWLSITASRTDLYLSQISVDLDGGRVVTCDDTRPYEHAPFGPCTFGLDGSIALYVTSERNAEGNWNDAEGINDPHHGARITYIPASAVKRVELRYWSKITGKAEEVVEVVEPDGEKAVETAAEQNPECRLGAVSPADPID